MQSVVFSSASNPLRNGFGLLHTGVERHQDEEGEIQNGAHLRQQRTARGSRDGTQNTEDHEADTEDHHPQLAQPALVADRLDRAAIQPGQDEQHSDGSTHGQHTRERGAGDGRNGTQDGVEGREVPYRSNMVRGLQGVGDFEVRLLQEVATHLREEEHHSAEDEQEYGNADNVLHCVVRVEGNAIQRYTVLVLQLLDLDPVGVVGTHFMQGNDVQHNQPQQDERHGYHMQRKEAVQGDTGNQVITTHPLGQIRTDDRDGTKQGDDHLGTPVGHLAPGQQVAHERLGHQRQVDQHAEDPHQLAGLAVGTVHDAAQHVQVDHHEERRGTGGVQIAQQPTPFHITHDVFDGGEGAGAGRLVAHGQPDTGDDLVDQHQQRQGAEEVEEVEVLRCVVLAQVIFPDAGDRHAFVDPIKQLAHQAVSS